MNTALQYCWKKVRPKIRCLSEKVFKAVSAITATDAEAVPVISDALLCVCGTIIPRSDPL